MPTITDWLMVIITFVYVVATIFICVANVKSSNAAKEQTEEMKRQFYCINRPKIAAEIVYLKRAFWVLRFVNNGTESAYNTKIIINQEFIDCIEEEFKNGLEKCKGTTCTIGVNQHYDIFFGSNKFRDIECKEAIKGKIICNGVNGSTYAEDFEIITDNYAPFFSVTTAEEDLTKEISDINKTLLSIERKMPMFEEQFAVPNNNNN